MKKIVFFIYQLIINLAKKRRFLRLNPSFDFFKRVYFYDKKTRKIFSVVIDGANDNITVDQIYTNHDYNLENLRRFKDIKDVYQSLLMSKKTPAIIDCGGNIGLSSRYFSSEFPSSVVVCIEPDEKNIELAIKNNKDYNNVTFSRSAIGPQDNFGMIVNPDSGGNSYQVAISEYNKNFEIKTIASAIQLAKNLDNSALPFIIKIDIEGFESDLFSLDSEWINDFYLIIIELHDWMLPGTASSRNFLREISKWDRDFVYVGENIFSIKN